MNYIILILLFFIASCSQQPDKNLVQSTDGDYSPTAISKNGNVNINYSNMSNLDREALLGSTIIDMCADLYENSPEVIMSLREENIPGTLIKFGKVITHSGLLGIISDSCSCSSRVMTKGLQNTDKLFLTDIFILFKRELRRGNKTIGNPSDIGDLEMFFSMVAERPKLRIELSKLLSKYNYTKGDLRKIRNLLKSSKSSIEKTCAEGNALYAFDEIMASGINKEIIRAGEALILDIKGTPSRKGQYLLDFLVISKNKKYEFKQFTDIHNYKRFFFKGAKITLYLHVKENKNFAIPIENRKDFLIKY